MLKFENVIFYCSLKAILDLKSVGLCLCLSLCVWVCAGLGELLCRNCEFRAAGDAACADGVIVHGTF